MTTTDGPNSMSVFGKIASRRRMLATLAAIGTVPIYAPQIKAQAAPPAFRTAKYQFTFVRPAAELQPIVLTDLNGRAATLSPVPGKVLLINLWATWCEACRLDLPLLERLHLTMSDRVAVVAVSMDTSNRAEVSNYVKQLSIHRLRVLLDPEARLLQGATERPAPLQAYGFPITYLISTVGQIEGYIAGPADWLADDAQELLAYYLAL